MRRVMRRRRREQEMMRGGREEREKFIYFQVLAVQSGFTFQTFLIFFHYVHQEL